MLQFVILLPVLLIVLYVMYLVTKAPTVDDKFFHLEKKLGREEIISRIKLLEEINQMDYSDEISRIKKFYADGRITDSEAIAIEKIITNSYFGKFGRKWAAFRKADRPMKTLFIMCLVYGFVYVNIVFFLMPGKHELNGGNLITYIAANATLIIPFISGMTLFCLLPLILSFLSISFGDRGGVARAAATSEELLKALKPGGRKTPIVLNGRGINGMTVF